MAALSDTPPLTRASIQTAHQRIKHLIHRTPILTCATLNILASTPQSPESLVGTPYEGQRPSHPRISLFFKCENYQRIGAFKIRGASYALSRLSKEELSRGVVTHSSGNHAQALALAARNLHVTAHIVMPTISTPSKIAATKSYGARVYFSGSTSDEREAVVADVIRDTGAVLVPPYDHPDIILGQGTVGLETEDQYRELIANEPALSVHKRPNSQAPTTERSTERGAASVTNGPTSQKPHLDALLVPLGGGGLLSGCATHFAPTPTAVFGCEPSFQGADDALRGLASDPQTRIPHVSTLTIADGLRTPLGEIPWTIISDASKVRGVFAVTEAQIKSAMRLILERMKVVVEPSGAVGLAVALYDEGFRRIVEREGQEEGWDVGVVLSGGNTSVEAIASLYNNPQADAGSEEQKMEREEGTVGMLGERMAENVAG